MVCNIEKKKKKKKERGEGEEEGWPQAKQFVSYSDSIQKKRSFSLIRKNKRVEFEPDIELKLLNEPNLSFNTFNSSLSSLIRAYSNK